MASSKDFVQFVCDQLRDAGDISFTKMFGEYAVYCDGKVVALVCNDQVFVKKIDASAAILGENAEEAPPYPGAKMHFLVTDLDDRQLMTRLIRAVWSALPPPKPKKAKAPKTLKATAPKTKTRATKAAQSVAARLTGEFLALKDDKQAVHLARFFKTGVGQYGEGDRFLGIKVPVTRSLVKPYIVEATLADCDALLNSEWHELRLAALLLMVGMAERLAKQNDKPTLQELVEIYDRRLERANNWDLIDLSVYKIMGAYWQCNNTGVRERRRFLKTWATSGNLWRERAAMVSTYALQRMGSLEETFWLHERLHSQGNSALRQGEGRHLVRGHKGAVRHFVSGDSVMDLFSKNAAASRKNSSSPAST